MSRTWADAIIIQAVANCLNLLVHIAESNPTFSPVTVVGPLNITNALNIYIGHLDETYFVSTTENKTMEIRDNNKQTKNADENKQLMTVKNVKLTQKRHERIHETQKS